MHELNHSHCSFCDGVRRLEEFVKAIRRAFILMSVLIARYHFNTMDNGVEPDGVYLDEFNNASPKYADEIELYSWFGN